VWPPPPASSSALGLAFNPGLGSATRKTDSVTYNPLAFHIVNCLSFGVVRGGTNGVPGAFKQQANLGFAIYVDQVLALGRARVVLSHFRSVKSPVDPPFDVIALLSHRCVRFGMADAQLAVRISLYLVPTVRTF
jgi:hypothetical protein